MRSEPRPGIVLKSGKRYSVAFTASSQTYAHRLRHLRLIPSRFDHETPSPSVLRGVTDDPNVFDLLLDFESLTDDPVLAGQGVTYIPLQHIPSRSGRRYTAIFARA